MPSNRDAERLVLNRLRAGLRRLRARASSVSMANLDPWPTPVLVAFGLVPAAVLGWLALHNLAATLFVLLLIPAAAVWQGRRVRVVWERGIPAEVDETPPVRRWPGLPGSVAEAEEPPVPQPPYAVQDTLIEMMELPGGSFRMGSDQVQNTQAYPNERPLREVRIRPFAMAVTPVTRRLYRSLIKDSLRQWRADKDDDLPANHLSWMDAVRFCNLLSKRSGFKPCYRRSGPEWRCDWNADGYRLPTEAEWEYACRAGTETPWFWGADEKDAKRYAWFAANSSRKPRSVGTKVANRWGLCDMAGNVREWCWDWYADAYDSEDLDNPRGPASGEWRVLRGGSFDLGPRVLRSADRLRDVPEFRLDDIGFRCVRGSGRQLGH